MTKFTTSLKENGIQIFINNLPKMMQEVQIYGYADDLKAIARNQKNINKTTETIQTWLDTNKLKRNTKESHT